MIKLKWWYHHWRMARLEERLAYHREVVKDIVITGGSFHFEEGTITGNELDDEEPKVHVVPTYYDYDTAGEASGEVNKEFRLGD